jgi:hypothetical protein
VLAPLAQLPAVIAHLAPPAPPTSALAVDVAAHLARAETERLQPWRATWALIEQAIKTHRAASREDLKHLYAEQAKATGFSPVVAAWLTSLLYIDPAEQLVIASALLKNTGAESTQIFNGILTSLDTDPDAPIAERGRSIIHLHTPLWPPGASFAPLRLAQLTSATPHGGGPTSSLPPTRGFIVGQALASGPAFGPSLALAGATTTTTTISTDAERIKRLEDRLIRLERRGGTSSTQQQQLQQQQQPPPQPTRRPFPRGAGGDSVAVTTPTTPPPTVVVGQPGFRPVPQQ